MKKIIILLFVLLSGTTQSTNLNEVPAHIQKDFECMAENIYHEARGESTSGMKAVANIVLNRMKSSLFPDTVCEVIYQKNQFSWIKASRKIDFNKIPDKIKWIAFESLVNNQWKDNTGGALFFHVVNAETSWNMDAIHITTKIGNHVFYKYRKTNNGR